MKEETVLSLKWHSFPSHLAGSLDTCYEKQQFVDLSLVCKDGTILKCHKMILANSSSFFRRLLVANDHPHPMIILHDIEADDLKTIVNFMYCGEIQVVQSEVRRLLKIAELLEVTGLRHIQTSVLVGESNNANYETTRKTSTMSRFKPEEGKSLPSRSAPEHEINTRSQAKNVAQPPPPPRFTPHAHPHKGVPKSSHELYKKNDESNVNVLSQRLETGKSGISIVDINDIPSTSRGLQAPLPSKRKEPAEAVLSWPRILSAISKDKPLPLKKLCIMDEVEIIAGGPPVPAPIQDFRRNEPLDRRKGRTSSEESSSPMNCAVFIKDEIDISPEMEEDTDMDPLEVEELDNDNTEIVIGSSSMFPFRSIDPSSFTTGALPEYHSRKGANG